MNHWEENSVKKRRAPPWEKCERHSQMKKDIKNKLGEAVLCQKKTIGGGHDQV